MKTIYYTATSLDGFIATEDDSLDWLFSLGDASDTVYADFIAQVGALTMGASTYGVDAPPCAHEFGSEGFRLALHAALLGLYAQGLAGRGGRGHPLRPR